jgi:hypothetical protein
MGYNHFLLNQFKLKKVVTQINQTTCNPAGLQSATLTYIRKNIKSAFIFKHTFQQF